PDNCVSGDEVVRHAHHPPTSLPRNDENGVIQHSSWLNLLQAIKEEKMFLASSLELGKMAGLVDGVLTVAFPEKYNFYKETMEQPENRKVIEAKAKEVFQRDLKVKFILDKNLQAASSEEEQRSKEAQKKLSSEPIVQSALNIFQGRIVKGNSQ
ncbi:MAG: hypothetical protein KKA80_03165, partial [Candidatus Omnitrophica bacterium]|nr:hypothetical protein [Candidatus Omnitrophota bacterium]